MARGRPDFSPTVVDVVLRPEWAAKEGNDKNFLALEDSQAFGEDASVDYTVPVGKTLVITQLSGKCRAVLAADADNNQMCEVMLSELVGPAYTPRETVGGNGGAALALVKPRVFAAGAGVRFRCVSWANHSVNLTVVGAGYEY